MRDTRRQDWIGVLLAAAGLLAALGGVSKRKTPWFIGASVFLALAVLLAAAPASRRVGIVTVLGRWFYRSKLKEKPDWRSGNIPSFAGTTFVLRCEEQAGALPGFLCEVQGPSGDYFAYTDEAKTVLSATDPIDRLSLPAARPSAVLLFPDAFTVQDGEKLLSDQFLVVLASE